MLYDALDSVFLAVADLETAGQPYGRLGMRLSPAQAGRRSLSVGQAHNRFAVHFIVVPGSPPLLAESWQRAQATDRGLFAVALRVADLDLTLAALAARGVQSAARTGLEAWLSLQDQAGTDLVLVPQARSPQERHTEAVQESLLGHSFPLKRLDHLAVVAHDLEGKTRFWTEVLGVPVAGEVVTPTMVIRQLKIGDAVLELLGPASPDSPLQQRPPGLVSMVSWEVEDLAEAVRQARAGGFTAPETVQGVLPGTRTATIPGTELVGVNMQLLEYA